MYRDGRRLTPVGRHQKRVLLVPRPLLASSWICDLALVCTQGVDEVTGAPTVKSSPGTPKARTSTRCLPKQMVDMSYGNSVAHQSCIHAGPAPCHTGRPGNPGDNNAASKTPGNSSAPCKLLPYCQRSSSINHAAHNHEAVWARKQSGNDAACTPLRQLHACQGSPLSRALEHSVLASCP